MIIYYNLSPRSCIISALLQRVYNGECQEVNHLQGELFSERGSSISADDYSLEEAAKIYEKTFGKVPWLKGRQFEQFEKMLFFGLRFKGGNSGLLGLKILNQALLQGIGVVIGKLTPEAREFYSRARQVWAETHRVKGFIRFCPVHNQPGTMVGRAEFQHKIEDTLLRYFYRRYPGQKIILLRGNQAFFLKGGLVQTVSQRELKLEYNPGEFDELWSTFYDSQVIDGRLNKKLARKHIPKKLWSWIPEGEKLK